jgi:putative heme-binding domain-containing protein
MKITDELMATARDANQNVMSRTYSVKTLLAARSANPEILRGIIALVGQPQPVAFRTGLISALAATGEPDAGRALVDAFPGLPTASRDTAFDALVGRPEWTALLLDAMEAKKFAPAILGPLQLSRLTAHPDAALAARSKKLLAALGSGSNPAKDEIIARLTPAVEKPGDAAKGQALFTATCSTCHRLGQTGFEFGPALDGIGSHPAAELLVHIVDPSRMVDDEHRTWNIATKDGRQYSALIASENDSVVKLRQPGGVMVDVKVSEIATRAKAANSLMPEGFESLGPDNLRDIIAYVQSVAPKSGGTAPAVTTGAPAGPGATIVPAAALSGNFRTLDLSGAFTADTRKGLYASAESTRDTLPFVKFGRVVANGVPFDIANPATSASGKNVISLKGGPDKAFAQTMPQRVEIPVGFSASRLHFLGGVAGWGGGAGGDTPAMKVILHFAGGATQVADLRAGREFVDYIRRIDVPGSQFADGIVREHQIRTFAIPVQLGDVIEKIVLESAGNRVSPTTAAITAELGAPSANAPAIAPAPVAAKPAAKPESKASAVVDANDPKTIAPMGQKFAEPKPAGTLRVLLVGAGSSHDFPRYFLGADAVMLRATGGMDVAATPNLDEALALFPQADVLVLSANHGQFGQPAFQEALNKFADAGKGVVVLHAGTWRNWAPATGYNKRFVGGGAKSHGKGEFEVTVKQAAHPLMRGVPASFNITDENYHAEIDAGAAVEVLAENAPDKGSAHPSVWIVKDPKTRIACITLGHADEAHSNAVYKTLLVNAVRWVSEKAR